MTKVNKTVLYLIFLECICENYKILKLTFKFILNRRTLIVKISYDFVKVKEMFSYKYIICHTGE